MNYSDRIFGKIEIREPVILELARAASLRRLKGVDQGGYTRPFLRQPIITRFEHSLGACHLLKFFKAPLAEQIAGLAHDVSHGVFSHCLDYVFASGNGERQDHQDNIFSSFIKKTEIPAILEKHNFARRQTLDIKNFPLLEKKLPDLCADRIDYSLRYGLVSGLISKSQARFFIKKLKAENGQWIFQDYDSALKFTKLYSRLNSRFWTSLKAAAMMASGGACLKYALTKKYISRADLYTTDREVLVKIRKRLRGDKKLRQLFARMNNKVAYRQNPDDYDSRVFMKSRAIDPLCFYRGKLKRVSQIDLKWKRQLPRELKPKESFINFAK